MDGTGSLFYPFTRCLPANVETKIISYPSQEPLSYRQLEEYVVNQLPATGEYILIAESFSGPIALKIAGRANSGLKAVVLVASFAHGALGWLGKPLSRLPLRLILRIPLPRSLQRMSLLDKSAPADLRTAVRRASCCATPNVLAGRLKEALAGDYCRQPMSGNARVIAIFADKDRLLGGFGRQSIVKVCSKIEIETIRSPHLALQSNPLAVVDLLRKYDLLNGNPQTHNLSG
jgi:pimeloyl-[acyl-carrier protein] methyl ester esterase